MKTLFGATIFSILSIFAVQASAMASETPGVSKATYSSESSDPSALFQTVASRICCYAGGRPFLSTKSGCRNVGGQMVHGDRCYYPAPVARVCCKRGRADWWVRSARACRNQGGVVVRDGFCRWR